MQILIRRIQIDGQTRHSRAKSNAVGVLMLGAWVIPCRVPRGGRGVGTHGGLTERKAGDSFGGNISNSTGLLVRCVNTGLSLYIFLSDNSLLDFFQQYLNDKHQKYLSILSIFFLII